MKHNFIGKWITDKTFADLSPVDVFGIQERGEALPEDENKNSHILFRGKLSLDKAPSSALIYISADDYYKLYINGRYVAMGPAPSYHICYNYNTLDIKDLLKAGENTLAIHTYYQGYVNRVWQSGDSRQGLIFDIEVDGKIALSSDENIKTARHTGFSALGTVGYKTQFMESYDSSSPEDKFYLENFDDSCWQNASVKENDDHIMTEQKSHGVVLEEISPIFFEKRGNTLFFDFGRVYVGYVSADAKGEKGEKITLRAGQELSEDGSVRYKMRCNCTYLEEWHLSGENDTLNQFDYKAFRYLEIESDGNAVIDNVKLISRHYPFGKTAKLSDLFDKGEDSDSARKIWELCAYSLKYGVQETIQDCMDREKGFYLGDGCYTAFAHMILTKDDSMVRKLIDDAFTSSFINKGLATCMSCSFIQKIAEYPLILAELLVWHYRYSGDREYMKSNLEKMIKVFDFYKERYEKDFLLNDLDRWCVVEWPKNYRDGYAVDITEGKVCTEAHISINAYYLRAVQCVNKLLCELGKEKYRDEKPIYDRIVEVFYDKESHMFCDGEEHRNISLVGNLFPYSFGIAPDEKFEENFIAMLREKGEDKTFLFTTFPLLFRFVREGRYDEIRRTVLNDGTWKRMLREGATSTFEGWGKDCKWNTSLFHLTMASAVIFMADVSLSDYIQ